MTVINLGMATTPKLSKEQREGNIFAAFLKFCPLFTGEAIRDWIQPQSDPPDILCTTLSGKKVGVELRGWLQEDEMAYGISYERREHSVMEALGDQGDNPCKNVHWVWLHPKESARIRQKDRAHFRLQVLRKIAEMDEAMGGEDSWSPQGLSSADFSGHPVLAKYLDGIQCFPRKAWRNGKFVIEGSIPAQPWIHLPARGGAYSEQTMLQALYDAIDDKRNHYKSRPKNLQELCLLIHYDQALLYNSPVETPRFKYEDAAKLGSMHVGANPGVFDKIFLYLAIHPGEKVFQIH